MAKDFHSVITITGKSVVIECLLAKCDHAGLQKSTICMVTQKLPYFFNLALS